MTLENQTPAPEVPAQPSTPAPAPTEKRRISTASTRLLPEEAVTPPQPRADNGQFESPKPPIQTQAPPAVTPAQTTPPVQPKHPAWMTEMATELGFLPEDVEAMDGNSLGIAMRAAQRMPARQTPATPPPPPAPEPEPTVDLGLTPEQIEDLGPDMIGILTNMAKKQAIQTRELEKRLGMHEQNQAMRDQNEVFRTIDEAINGLGAEYAAILGSGQGHQVYKTSPGLFRKRKFVLDSLAAEGLNFQTAPLSVIQQKIKARTDEDFGTQAKPGQKPATPPVVSKQDWDRGGSPPPTQRNGGNELPPREGGSIEDRYRGAVTSEEIEDEKIRASLRRRKRPQQA